MDRLSQTQLDYLQAQGNLNETKRLNDLQFIEIMNDRHRFNRFKYNLVDESKEQRAERVYSPEKFQEYDNKTTQDTRDTYRPENPEHQEVSQFE
ncbi:hypothetical protein pb186bvf_015906 [Paramecium bursaria]